MAALFAKNIQSDSARHDGAMKPLLVCRSDRGNAAGWTGLVTVVDRLWVARVSDDFCKRGRKGFGRPVRQWRNNRHECSDIRECQGLELMKLYVGNEKVGVELCSHCRRDVSMDLLLDVRGSFVP